MPWKYHSELWSFKVGWFLLMDTRHNRLMYRDRAQAHTFFENNMLCPLCVYTYLCFPLGGCVCLCVSHCWLVGSISLFQFLSVTLDMCECLCVQVWAISIIPFLWHRDRVQNCVRCNGWIPVFVWSNVWGFNPCDLFFLLAPFAFTNFRNRVHSKSQL